MKGIKKQEKKSKLNIKTSLQNSPVAQWARRNKDAIKGVLTKGGLTVAALATMFMLGCGNTPDPAIEALRQDLNQTNARLIDTETELAGAEAMIQELEDALNIALETNDDKERRIVGLENT